MRASGGEMNIWLTTSCNMSCRYCYERKNISEEKNMSQEMAEKVLLYIEPFIKPEDNIVFHGGEPLLNFPVMKFFTEEFLQKYPRIKFGFTTNGTVWNDNIRTFLMKYREHYEGGISVSIDGDKETHNGNRVMRNREESYETVIHTIQELREIFTEVRGRMTISADSVNHTSESVKHLFSLGLNPISHAFDLSDKNWDSSKMCVAEKEYEEIYAFWKEHKDLDISFIDELRYRKKLGRCEGSINIYPNGDIYPCMEVAGNTAYKMGDVEGGIDRDSWQRIKKRFLKDNESCERCVQKENCIHNRCKLINAQLTGNEELPAKAGCALEHVKHRFYMKYKGEGFLN